MRPIGGRRTSLFVHDDGEITFSDWLAQPHVKHGLRSTELALSAVENGTGSIEDVNLHYGIITLAPRSRPARSERVV